MSLVAKHTRHGELPSAIDVAREFFAHAKREQSPEFTAYKLQKLLYYAQAISQRDRGRSLFRERVRAWDNGPVVANVFHETEGMKVIPYSHESLGAPSNLGTDDRRVVLVVWERFKHLTGDELRDRTHREPAYTEARKQKSIFNRNPVIQPSHMRNDVENDRESEMSEFSAFMDGIQAGS